MPYIYESPDGGHTVYARQFGEQEKKKISESERVLEIKRQLSEAELWGKIRIAAMSNPAIAKALDQARLIYELSKQDEN